MMFGVQPAGAATLAIAAGTLSGVALLAAGCLLAVPRAQIGASAPIRVDPDRP